MKTTDEYLDEAKKLEEPAWQHAARVDAKRMAPHVQDALEVVKEIAKNGSLRRGISGTVKSFTTPKELDRMVSSLENLHRDMRRLAHKQ